MNTHLEAVRKLLESQGDNKPETIESTLKIIEIQDNKEKIDGVRSWASVVISFIAIVISLLALFVKTK